MFKIHDPILNFSRPNLRESICSFTTLFSSSNFLTVSQGGSFSTLSSRLSTSFSFMDISPFPKDLVRYLTSV